MTYCLGMLCRKGAVFLSDSRTSAGMDNITVRTKMRIYEKPDDRVICIMSSGNPSLTQATLALIDDDLHLHESHPARKHLMNRETPYETVRYVGSKVREVEQRDRAALEADGFDFNINLTVGGQIAGLAPEVHSIHPAAEQRSREQGLSFLQIGESKYGKPILDRGFSYRGYADGRAEIRNHFDGRDDEKQRRGRFTDRHSLLQDGFAAGENAHASGAERSLSSGDQPQVAGRNRATR